MLIIIIKGLATKNHTKLSASDTKPIVVWPGLAGQQVIRYLKNIFPTLLLNIFWFGSPNIVRGKWFLIKAKSACFVRARRQSSRSPGPGMETITARFSSAIRWDSWSWTRHPQPAILYSQHFLQNCQNFNFLKLTDWLKENQARSKYILFELREDLWLLKVILYVICTCGRDIDCLSWK